LAKFFKHTPAILRHTTPPITFSLADNDFGVKYLSADDANRLFSSL